MIALVATFLVNRYAWDFDATVAWIKKLIRVGLVALIVALVLFGGYCGYSKYVSYRIAQKDAELAPVDKAVVEGRISKDAVNTENPKKEAVNASKRSNEAIQNVNTARSTDSRNFNADDGAARERFCRNYPTDSECQPR